MSDSQDKSDDLIAELAKLMASNAQSSENETKPTVIKLAPLGDATVPPPAPIRIPGMQAQPATAAPAVRIPGMEKPAGIDHPPAPNPGAAPEPKVQPQSAGQGEYSKPAAPPPGVASEAPVAWQRPEAPKPAPVVFEPLAGGITPPAPQPVQTPLPQVGAKSSAEPPRVEPLASAAPAPSAIAPEIKPMPSAAADTFHFNFGFSSNSGTGRDKPEESPEMPAQPNAAAHDPIADLIAAELDAAQAEPTKPDLPKPEEAKPAPAFPASVEVVPARNFGNPVAGQAPVLVAKPVPAAPQANPAAPLAFRPLSPVTPKPTPESDKFAVAPVFGLGVKPAPAAAPPVSAQPVIPTPTVQAPSVPPAVSHHHSPRPDSDPMDEIESLIGEAVRVQLSASEQPAAKPAPSPAPAPAPAAPVVPPLTTGFAPRRAGLKDSEPQVKSAEAAILAAAAATGAEVGRIEPRADADRPYKRAKAKPEKTNMFGGVRQYVGMAVAGTLLLAAGFGLYWVLGMGRDDGTAPVLTADTTPAKQAPAVAAAEVEQPARSVVFDEIDGVAAADNPETLVSRDATAGASVADVASVVAPKAPESTETGLANRKVRTVTVRPDGTIVSGDEAVAGTQALPVERPNVPEVPGADTEPSDLLTAAVGSEEIEPDPAAAAPATASPADTAALDPIAAAIEGQPAEQQQAPLEIAALAPTDSVPPVFDASIVAPTPMPRPTDRSALGAGSSPAETEAEAAISPRAPASTPLVAVVADTAPATPQASSGSTAYVQLASLPSEGEARSQVGSMQSRWGGLFGGQNLVVQRAELGDGRVTYRVRLPTSSLQDATQICASIKANGGDCFATNG